MTIQLDHLIVPSRDPIASAQRLADLLDVPWQPSHGHFTPVYLNDGTTLDFARREQVEGLHVCFRIGDAEFDAIFARLERAGIPYRSQPSGANDMTINTRLGGKNVYWEDADGHLWEILTVSYARSDSPAIVGAG